MNQAIDAVPNSYLIRCDTQGYIFTFFQSAHFIDSANKYGAVDAWADKYRLDIWIYINVAFLTSNYANFDILSICLSNFWLAFDCDTLVKTIQFHGAIIIWFHIQEQAIDPINDTIHVPLVWRRHRLCLI